MHWLQNFAFVVATLSFYFGLAFFNDANLNHLALKIFKFWNCNGNNFLRYFVMRWEAKFYL